MRLLSFLFTRQHRPDEDTEEHLHDLIYDIGRYLATIKDAINGRITFGDATAIDNVAGAWISVTSHAVGGTETAIQHNLGVIPTGALMMVPPASGTWNRGATAWSTTHIYLTFSANSQTCRLFLTVPPLSS